MNDEARNVHQRLASAMTEVAYIQNEQKQGMQYRIVSHDKVTKKVRPALLAAGIVYYPVDIQYAQHGNRTECRLTVRFVNIDAPADFFDVPSLGYGVDGQDKGPGKAISYAVKYALLKAMGLETGDDPDADADTPPHSTSNPHQSAPDRDVLDAAKEVLTNADTLDQLKAIFVGLPKPVKAHPEVIKAKDARKAELEKAAETTPPDLAQELGDDIPDFDMAEPRA